MAMRHQDFDEQYQDAVRGYRPPPSAPVDALWPRIEREAFDVRARRRGAAWTTWLRRAAPLAAAAVLGIMVGRASAPDAPPATDPAPAASAPGSLAGAADEYLDRTAALLTALPAQAPGPDHVFVAQASDLLSTTRLLLDSPTIGDADFAALLEDLELVLVQIARLPDAAAEEEMSLITEALEDRDVMARLRTVTLTPPRSRS
jgi:hypothetical protein